MVEAVDEPAEPDMVLTVPQPVPRRAFGRGVPAASPAVVGVARPSPAVPPSMPPAPPAVPPRLPPVAAHEPAVEPIHDDPPPTAWPGRDWWVSTGTSLVVHVVVLTLLALLVTARDVDARRPPIEIAQQLDDPDEVAFVDPEELAVEVVAVEPEPAAEEPVEEAAAPLVADAPDIASDAAVDTDVDPGLVAMDAAGMLATVGAGGGAGGAGGGAGGFGGDVGRRLARAGAKTGDIQVSLSWDNFNDLDLHVITPTGERIWFARRRSRCRGMLDVDMNATGPATREPVENVFWPAQSAPRGEYQVFVHHFARYDAAENTAFEVHVLVDGKKRRYSGSVGPGEPPTLVTRFERTGRPAAAGDEFVE